jgi:exopolyphosphatase/guanosine-5'-triphosphate,3'-diphosphate pyrophosphatase
LVLGCVDIGSNTTRLLVAEVDEGGLRPLLNERVFTRIGRSLLEGGHIPTEKIAQTAEVVAAQSAAAREAGAEHVAAVATAAIRNAPNGPELAAAVEQAGGMPLWILSPDEEAELSFVGATRTLPEIEPGPIAVLDVGGGSTELAIGTPAEGVSWCASFEIGSGLLADAHLHSDPPAHEEIEAVRHRVAETFNPLQPPRTSKAVAVGGTATSLRRLLGGELSPEALERGLAAVVEAPAAQVAARYELDPERVRLLPAGILVLRQLASRLGVALQVARGGLREGVVLELLERRAGVRGS